MASNGWNFLFVLISFGGICQAQDLTVHVIDQHSKQPLANALVRLHYGCWHSMRQIEIKQKTNDAGIAIFHSVSLKPLEFCITPDSDAYDTRELYVFASPEDAQNYTKSLNTVFTTLPAEVTFHVRQRSFAERVRNIFRWE
jgi:hypothetical protein